MNKETKTIATKKFGFIATKSAVTIADKTIGTFNEAIDELISIYLTPLKLGAVNILVIGC